MPNNNNDTTTKLGIDVAQFKRGLQDVGRQIKQANAEFEKAAAGMDKWSDSTNGVQAKIKQLETVLDAENKKLEIQRQRLIEVEREQGKNSAGADELRLQITKQEAAIAKTEKSLGYFNGKLSDLNKAENQAKTATGALTTTIDDQQNELDALKKKYTEVVLAQGANSKEAKALGAQISALSGDLATNKQKLSDAEGAADKLDKSLTEVGDAADEAGKDAESAANGGFTVLKGVMANLATEAINAALNGLKNMGSALLNVGKQAVAGYAEYEQLSGGIETLFGAGGKSIEEYAGSMKKPVTAIAEEYKNLMTAQDTVLKNASQAYKTAGMSANEYMENVTSFSASLISSLDGDTVAAAQAADQAIIDMSDNANKMGTDITSIQNAYQGFAKQNYTMLDNLKLGYGGTKEEMERLLADASELSGVEYNIDNLNDVYEAIHVVQTEMGITGTTAEEAAQTIEGSANAMKASWGNLVTGLADENADLDGLINNFIDSLLTYAGNIMPVIQTAIGGITTLITQLVSELLPQLLDIIAQELPGFLNAGAELLVTLITGIVSAIPQLTTAILEAISMIITTISESIPDIVDALVTAFPLFVSAILDAIPDLLDAGVELLTALVDAIPLIIPMFTKELPKLIKKIVTTLNKSIPTIITAGIDLLNGLLEAIPQILPVLIPAIGDLIVSLCTALVENAPLILDGAIEALNAIIEALPIIADALAPEIINLVGSIARMLGENIPVLFKAAKNLFMVIVTQVIPDLLVALSDVGADFIEVIVEAFVKPAVQNMKDGWEKIKEIFSVVGEWFKGIFTTAYTNIKNAFSAIGSWFTARWNDIKTAFANVGTWFKDKFTTAYTNVKNAFSSIGTWFSDRWTDIKDVFTNIPTWFKNKFNDAWTKIKNVFTGVGDFFGGIWDTIKEKFTDIGQKVGDAIGEAFKTAINFVLETAETVLNAPINAINNLLDVINEIPGISLSELPTFDLPRLERGGVLKRGQVGLLEGNGSEAVVPLDQNKKWINKTARDMKQALKNEGVINNSNSNITNNYNITQNNTSPKALSRLEIYRQTKNVINLATGG